MASTYYQDYRGAVNLLTDADLDAHMALLKTLSRAQISDRWTADLANGSGVAGTPGSLFRSADFGCRITGRYDYGTTFGAGSNQQSGSPDMSAMWPLVPVGGTYPGPKDA